MLQDPEAQALTCERCAARRAGMADDVALTLEGFGPEEVGITYDADGVAHDSDDATFDDAWRVVSHR